MERKEAIEVVKENYPHVTFSGSPFETALRTLIPELQESEDEKIRKEIIYHIQHCDDTIDEVAEKRMLAWLEKQKTSEKALQYLKENHSPSEVSDFQAAMNIAVAKAYDKGYNDALEKQSEQKQDPCEHCDDVKLNCHNFPCIKKKAFDQGKSVLEVIKEENVDNANKVEPKFKIGDWVVSDCNNVAYIESISETSYNLQCEDGYHEKMSIGYIDKYWHLWTIKDAKDGDVLVTTFDEDNMIIMYHSMCTKDTINVHCCLDNKFVCWNLGVFDAEDVKPATKEQRDLLFQKMKEAGYEWDSEKREPKKKKLPKCVIDEGKSEIDYCFTKMMNGEKISSAWGEEDDKVLGYILNDLRQGVIPDNDDIEWLKSLKDRVQPRWEQEWSEDDKGNLLMIKHIVDGVWHNQHFREDIGYSTEELESLWNWLDNIWQRVKYPQNIWKPSDTQMKRFRDILDYHQFSTEGQKIMQSLYDDLKKLNEE